MVRKKRDWQVSPYQQSLALNEQLYGATEGKQRFHRELKAHYSSGHVYANDKIFLVGRAVVRGSPMVSNCKYIFKNPDAWFIWFAAGDMRMLWKFLPEWLPWIGWSRRDGIPKFYPTFYLAKKCKTSQLVIPFFCNNNSGEEAKLQPNQNPIERSGRKKRRNNGSARTRSIKCR